MRVPGIFTAPTAESAARRRPCAAAGLLAALVLSCAAARAAEEGLVLLPVRDAQTHALLRDRARAQDPIERVEAALALGLIGQPADFDLLATLLNDPDARVRAQAIAALGQVAPARLTPHAPALAVDPDPVVRAAFFRAARAAPEVAAGVWAAGLEDADARVRAAAARVAPLPAAATALRALRDGTDGAGPRIAAWERLIEAAAPQRAEALNWALEQPDATWSARAFAALTPDDNQASAVDKCLATRQRGPALLAAVTTVERLGLAAAGPTLLAHMPRYEALARQAACRTLGNFSLPGVVEALARRLVQEDDLAIAQTAALALARLADASATVALVGAVTHSRDLVRQWALEALAERADPVSLPAVRRALHDPIPAVRTAALEALRRTDPQAAQPDLARVREQTRSAQLEEAAAALRLLGAMGDRQEIPFMANLLNRISADAPCLLRVAALEALTDLEHADMVPRVLLLATAPVVPIPMSGGELAHDCDAVRCAALRYLERCAAPALAPALIAAFDVTPPYPVRVALAGLMTRWTGTPHQAQLNYRHRAYSIESLALLSYQPQPPPPGIRPGP